MERDSRRRYLWIVLHLLYYNSYLHIASILLVIHQTMVVPLGISIGDFIAVGKLAFEIATALNDCRGAATEYKSLIELLRSLQTSVSLISNYVSSSSSCATLKVDQAFMNGLLFHAGCCHRLLNQFIVCPAP